MIGNLAGRFFGGGQGGQQRPNKKCPVPDEQGMKDIVKREAKKKLKEVQRRKKKADNRLKRKFVMKLKREKA